MLDLPSCKALFNLYSMTDGLNDDLVVAAYNNDFKDTIGVKDRNDTYTIMVRHDGYYDTINSDHIVRERVTRILHEFVEISEQVLKDTQTDAEIAYAKQKTDRDDHDKEVLRTRARADELKKYASMCRNDGRRNSIYASIAKQNSIPAEKLDSCDNMISIPNGTIIIDRDNKKWTYDPADHPEMCNTMIMGIPYNKDSTKQATEYAEHVKDLLSYNIYHDKREDLTRVESEARLVRALHGYWMLQGNPDQVIVKADGPGGSGKSTLAEIIVTMCGTYGLMSRRDLIVRDKGDRIRADVGQAVTKHFGAVDELKPGDVIDTGQLKYYTNKKIIVEVKHKNPVERENNLKLLIISNYDNKFDAQDGSVERRLISLNFYKEEPKIKIPYYSDHLVKKYGSGILTYALHGLTDYLEAGSLWQLVPEHIKQAVHDKLLMQDPLRLHLERHLPKTKDMTETVLLSDVWADIKNKYADIDEKPPIKQHRLGNILRSYGYDTFLSSGVTKVRGCVRVAYQNQAADNVEIEQKKITDTTLPIGHEKTIAQARADELEKNAADHQTEMSTKLRETIRSVNEQHLGSGAPVDEVVNRMKTKNYNTESVHDEIKRLENIGEITVNDGWIKEE